MSSSLTFEFVLLTPQQWQLVATGALLSSLSASGVYAWLLMQQAPQQHASSQILPLWLTQTVVGLLALVAGQAADAYNNRGVAKFYSGTVESAKLVLSLD